MGFHGPALTAAYAISAGAAAIAGNWAAAGWRSPCPRRWQRGQVLAQRGATLLIDLTAVAAAAGLAMLVFALVFGMHLGVAALASAAAAPGIFGIIAGALVVLAVSLALVIAGSIAFARRDLI
jgi:hypothetical protein